MLACKVEISVINLNSLLFMYVVTGAWWLLLCDPKCVTRSAVKYCPNIFQTAGVIGGVCLILFYCQHKLLTYVAELTVDTKFYWCNSLYTQRDATSQCYHLLGKGMVFPSTRQGGTWGEWRYGSTQWHKWGPSRHRGSGAFKTYRILRFVVGFFFRAGFCSVRRQYYGSLLRGLGLNSVVIIEGPDYRVAALTGCFCTPLVPRIYTCLL